MKKKRINQRMVKSRGSNFWTLKESPGVPILNIRGVSGLTFKLWGKLGPVSQGLEVLGPGVLVQLLHYASGSRNFRILMM